jgi:lysophospholipase L1-like esterase
MADYAAHTEGVTFVDVNTPILAADGGVDNGYFEDDLLHVNRKGYAVWASVLRPMLLDALGK